MGKLALMQIDSANLYGCALCKNYIAAHDSTLSNSFHSGERKAFLFRAV